MAGDIEDRDGDGKTAQSRQAEVCDHWSSPFDRQPKTTVCHPGVSERSSLSILPPGSRQRISTRNGLSTGVSPKPKCSSWLRFPE